MNDEVPLHILGFGLANVNVVRRGGYRPGGRAKLFVRVRRASPSFGNCVHCSRQQKLARASDLGCCSKRQAL